MYQFSLQIKSYSELQSRTEPNCHDIASAFIDLGIDLNSLFKYIRSQNLQRTRTKVAKRNIKKQTFRLEKKLIFISI